MIMDIEIVCMRHPKIRISRDHCYGQYDVLPCPEHLNELYEENKNFVKEFDFIYSSPLTRCAQLAKKLSHSVIFDKRLKEIHFGDWEMKKWQEIGFTPQDFWLKSKGDFCFPGGESFNGLKSRIFDFLKDKEKHLKKAFLITHSGVIRALFVLLKKEDYESALKRKIVYGEKVSFKYNGPLKSAFLK